MAVRWTAFLGSSLGKLCPIVSMCRGLPPSLRHGHIVACAPLHLSPVTGSPLAREEGQRAVAGRFELPVRHVDGDRKGGAVVSCVGGRSSMSTLRTSSSALSLASARAFFECGGRQDFVLPQARIASDQKPCDASSLGHCGDGARGGTAAARCALEKAPPRRRWKHSMCHCD